MSLKNEIVNSCSLCKGSGWLDGEACSCLLKFRIYNRLLSAGFSRSLVDYCNQENYEIPQIDLGEEFVNFFLEKPFYAEEKGLGLYVYSQERGRGKTTLTHKIMYEALKYFVSIDSYSTYRTYAFQHVEDLLKSFQKEDSECLWKSTWYVLDDLGNEDRTTEWRKGLFLGKLQSLLHYRRDKRLPTLITSNYRPADLSILYGGELDSLLEIKPGGVLGGTLYRSVEVGGGEDLRLLEENSLWPGDL